MFAYFWVYMTIALLKAINSLVYLCLHVCLIHNTNQNAILTLLCKTHSVLYAPPPILGYAQ